MARKKSATKRAREALEKDTTQGIEKPVAKDSLPDKKKQIQEESNDEDESSSSEEEDEYGNLITSNVQEGINKILSTLKSDPKKLLDPEVKFFEDPENEENTSPTNKSKETPIYLKDYHRMNLLSGNYKDEEDNEFGTVDGEKPYAITQREERNQLISDIKSQFNDEDENDDDDDFLTKKENVRSRNFDEEETKLPDPEANQEEFLSAFIDKQAWIPKKNDKVIDLDKIDNEDDEQFDQAVEYFERAYNFRYEDPNSAEIVSYARNQATLRRSATNSRKRQRDKKNEEREKEEESKKELLKKKKTAKLNKVMDRLEKIKQAVGDEVDDEIIKKVFGDSLLSDDFDDADWDSKMAEIFNEQYYNAEISKPEWDEDDEIMAEFNKQKQDEAEDGGECRDEEQIEEENVEEPPLKKSKKDKLKDKKAAKKEKESLKEKAHEIVEANTLKILDEVEEERGRSRSNDEVKFKYREVSPETFGLTTRDILLADDKQLNNFIGLKKFAPYRPKELRLKDKRKYTKKKHLQDWRKEVFHDKNGPKLPKESTENEIWIPVDAAESDSKHRHKGLKKDKKDKKGRRNK